MIGHVMREFLPWQHLLTYLDAILRVYNRYGRRDNLNKARVKILVKERARQVPRRDRGRVGALKDGPRRSFPRRSSASRRGSRGRRTRNSKIGVRPNQDKSGLTRFFSCLRRG